MTESVNKRKVVREFFEYELNSDRLKPLPWNAKRIAGVGALGGSWGLVHGDLSSTMLYGVLGVALGIGIDRYLIERRRKAKEKNHRIFAEKAEQVRKIQAEDLERAFDRIFSRTGIDPEDLQQFDSEFVLEAERSLFDKKSLGERVRDLRNKSLRMISQGDFANEALRIIDWGTEREWFPNPRRLVALLLTKKQLVVCDVEVDSMEGGLKDEIQRIGFNKIVNIVSTSAEKRTRYDEAMYRAAAERAGLKAEEIDATVKKAGDEGQLVFSEKTILLRLSLNDGSSMMLPVRKGYQIGVVVGALDDDSVDTELNSIDRMVQELNRRVEQLVAAE